MSELAGEVKTFDTLIDAMQWVHELGAEPIVIVDAVTRLNKICDGRPVKSVRAAKQFYAGNAADPAADLEAVPPTHYAHLHIELDNDMHTQAMIRLPG